MNTSELIARLKKSGADTDAALRRCMNDDELYCSCVRTFCGDKNFALLDKALAEGRLDEAFAAVHTIKGVAANLGLTDLYSSAYTLTETLRVHSTQGLEQQHAELTRQYYVLLETVGAGDGDSKGGDR